MFTEKAIIEPTNTYIAHIQTFGSAKCSNSQENKTISKICFFCGFEWKPKWFEMC